MSVRLLTWVSGAVSHISRCKDVYRVSRGTLHGFWYAFGTHDGYNVWEAPDNVSMAAVALAISGGGALSSFETTVLLTVEESMDALQRAGEIRYQAPGAS